ncbi:MAG: cytochrome c [Chthonomonadaceae bacterium]|nr:cytochrome c [Chthonomonadaceae bacterium]
MWRQPKVRPQQESDFFADGIASRLPVGKTIARGQLKEDEAFYTGYTSKAADKHEVSNAVQNGPVAYGTPPGQPIVGSGENNLGAKPLTYIPIAVNKEVIKRGQERFNIFCTPCHGKVGDGNGMIALRGLALRRPPGNYHTDRLRKMPVGHFYDVITNGYGSMYSYASRIQDPKDRWAIVAYIRVLQYSRNAPVTDLTPEERTKLEQGATTTGEQKEQ